MIKLSISVFLIFLVKYIFTLINDYGDKNIEKMKELISFSQYLKVYSCHMKMPYKHIINKYSFKSVRIKNACEKMLDEIENVKKENTGLFIEYLNSETILPNEFSKVFAEISDYYGNTFSDVLEKKLDLSIKEMTNIMEEFEGEQKDKKNLYNRLSLLTGCLVAIILV